ncbi:MAG: DUF4922 domain-containing protein [Acidobacteriota bacterium]|nr:MAG: DUF4922 domain-containing protein [Acidobacteriota bacterium]
MRGRLLTADELDRWGAGGGSFRDRVKAMIAQQRATWPMLEAGFEGLAAVETREFSVNGWKVTGQFNPGRIVSTSAKIDPASIGKRPCFLCLENLPPEERGIAFDSRFVALCNPFPVLGDHLVVSSIDHIPQAIGGNMKPLLDLAEALGPEWFSFYNGPRCGASAPDHLHYQAASAGGIHVFDDLTGWSRAFESSREGVDRFALRDYRLNLAVFQGGDGEALLERFAAALEVLKEVAGESDEPMINLAVRFDDRKWTLIIYPRGKHRPACYFAEGEARLTVSPGAIDFSGVMVIPERAHFDRMTVNDVSGIFREVTLDDQTFAAWLAKEGRDR